MALIFSKSEPSEVTNSALSRVDLVSNCGTVILRLSSASSVFDFNDSSFR